MEILPLTNQVFFVKCALPNIIFILQNFIFFFFVEKMISRKLKEVGQRQPEEAVGVVAPGSGWLAL
jgi:hypothetical protein